MLEDSPEKRPAMPMIQMTPHFWPLKKTWYGGLGSFGSSFCTGVDCWLYVKIASSAKGFELRELFEYLSKP